MISFEGISNYSIKQHTFESHRDLITFEIGVEEIEESYSEGKKEWIVFRAEFAQEEDILEIFAKDIKFEEKIYSSDK